MKRELEWTTAKGIECKIVAEYEKVMERTSYDLDGDIIYRDAEPVERASMTVYADGKKIAKCLDVFFWGLIDVPNNAGVKKISGLPVGFSKSETIKQYEEFVKSLIEDGTSDEAKSYEAAKENEAVEEELQNAKEIVRMAESQNEILPYAEVKKYIANYSSVNNEGGEGYIPRIISKEEYDKAKRCIGKSF
jgi:hypothetical protein